MPDEGRFLKRRFVKGKTSTAVSRTNRLLPFALALLLLPASNAIAENCLTSTDMDPATRTTLTNAALHDFDLIAKGDAASLRQSAAPSLAADFSGIEATVKDNQAALAGAKAAARPPFLLEAEGTAPIPKAEFFCGVFGKSGQTRDSAEFFLNGLAPGKYGVVILDAPTSKAPYMVSLILQQLGADWKLGGLYIKAAQLGGHDSDWFIARAHQYQTKGQLHNAWLYTQVAESLISPLSFMSTAATDKLYDDAAKLQPADFPADGKTSDLSSGTAPSGTATSGTAAGPATYKVTAIFPEVVGNDLDLIVRYKSADVSNTNQTYQSNVVVMKALLTKYPELREAFAAVVARAVDPSGRDYGTMLAMKDIK